MSSIALGPDATTVTRKNIFTLQPKGRHFEFEVAGVAYVRLETAAFYQPDDDNLDLAVAMWHPNDPGLGLVRHRSNLDVIVCHGRRTSLACQRRPDLHVGSRTKQCGLKENRTSFTYATISDLSTEPSKAFCEREADPKSLRLWELTPN